MHARALLNWFARAKRPMPWRLKVEPYGCWLSEIMLQQTTYEQALPYYTRFLARFPTVAALAEADEEEVLKCWAGLGYYARARNLHKAARLLAGGWPKSAAEWAAIPGVGPYTAAALASVLDGECVPVVDGNVVRVFSRFWLLGDDFRRGTARARLAARLKGELFTGRKVVPGDLNQAMMELGALVCVPKHPQCAACPLKGACAARTKGCPEAYPQKPRRAPLPVRKQTVAVTCDGAGRVLMVKNADGGLLKGLWALPALSSAGTHVQVFSHFRQELTVLKAAAGAVFVDPGAVPLTTATKRILEKCGLLKP